MKIAEFVSPADVAIDLRADTKAQLLRRLAAGAAAAAQLPVEDVVAAVLKREELGSTGIGKGIALPHARMKAVTRPYAAVARLRHPIAFDAIDGQTIDIAVLLLLPDPDQTGVLAAVARRLKEPETLPRLRKAKSAAELHAAIAG